MKHYNVHIVAAANMKAMEQKLNEVKEYGGQEISIKVTGFDYSFSSFAHWTGAKLQEPDIVLLLDNASYTDTDLKTGKKIGYAQLLEDIKTAKLNLPNTKFIAVLSKPKEENLDFLNELIKLNIYNFYFPTTIRIKDILTWFFTDKTLKDMDKYIRTGQSLKTIKKDTETPSFEESEENGAGLGAGLKDRLLNKLKHQDKQNTKDKQDADTSEESIRIIEKEKIITEKELIIKEMDKAYIAVYSGASTGKSHTVWNLSLCLCERGYKTAVVDLDYGYSANALYGIDEIYYEALQTLINKNLYKDIMEYAYEKNGLSVIAKGLGDTSEISAEEYKNIMMYIRPHHDIVITDCRTGYCDILKDIIIDTNIDLLVFDMDMIHYQLTKNLVSKLGDLFIPEKTVAIINNCDINSESYRFIYNRVLEISKNFKDILPISSCGYMSCDLMDTGKYPYQEALKREEYKRFALDMDNLLDLINAKTASGHKTSTNIISKNIISKLFKKRG